MAQETLRVMDSTGDVKRFVIPGEEGYSDFWRRDKSPIEPIELVKLLVAIRKVASFVGRNVGEIVWSGMEVENAVALDPTPIIGTYPVPAAKTDLMIGIMVQEAYKRIEWSERLREMLKLRVQPPAQYEYKFDMFFTVCESVYVDGLANKSVLGYYAETARDWRIIRVLKNLIKPPTLAEMLYLWYRLAANRDPERYKEGHSDLTLGGLVTRGSLDQYYAKPMDTMNSIILPLRHDCATIPSVSDRCDFRLDLYEKLWRDVLKYIRFWPGDRSDKFMIPDMGEEDLAQEEEEQKAVKATIVNYANLIEAELPQKNKDFTEQVKGNVAKFENVVRIEGNDIVMMARNRVDAKLLRQIEQVVRSATDRRSVFNRGLTSGKIHRRRLYRALTTGAVFQEKKHEFELRKNVVLLVDATGSMADPTKWDKAEMTYQTLFTALLSYTPNARLFAYNEVKNACRITELYRGGRMLMVLPHGKTASGEAIIATALSSTRTPGKKTLLIHLTDGASNWGCGVEDAIKYCRKSGVSLLTLGVSCGLAAKQALREEYGKLVQFVDQTEQLPRLFGELIVTEMRESRTPQK